MDVIQAIMNNTKLLIFSFLIIGATLFAGFKHKRDGSDLLPREKEFAENLSVKHRRIFCGQFNKKQRDLTIQYSKMRGIKGCSPNDAVIKVMHETGMHITHKKLLMENP